MYAFVKSKSGNLYQSMVFGCYKELIKNDTFYYYIVLNEEKNKLIKVHIFDPGIRKIKMQILTTDCNQSDWNVDDDQCGQINFFDESIPQLVEKDSVPEDLLKKCIQLDSEYVYVEIPEIKTEQDIKNLGWVSGNFHDSYISKVEMNKKDDAVKVTFEDCWGCSIEMWFSDIVSMNIHTDDMRDDYWYSANMYFENEYFCLINEEDTKISKDTTGYIWFSSKKAKYRVIPSI